MNYEIRSDLTPPPPRAKPEPYNLRSLSPGQCLVIKTSCPKKRASIRVQVSKARRKSPAQSFRVETMPDEVRVHCLEWPDGLPPL